MKVGDYVRTPLGITKYIGKYDNYEGFWEFDKLDEELWTGDIANVVYSCEIDNIVLKSSPNIIDLIQEGDYVNGYLIEKVYDVFETSPNKLKEAHIKYADEDFISQLYDTEIKSIVTKEQFENCMYKVGE